MLKARRKIAVRIQCHSLKNWSERKTENQRDLNTIFRWIQVDLTDITNTGWTKSRIHNFLDKFRIFTKTDCIWGHKIKFNKLKDINNLKVWFLHGIKLQITNSTFFRESPNTCKLFQITIDQRTKRESILNWMKMKIQARHIGPRLYVSIAFGRLW